MKVFEVGSPVYAGSGLFMLDSETYALINPVYPYSVTGVDGLNDGEPYFENVRLAYDQAKHFSNLFGEQITISAVMK
ncbi:MAG: hypothetical protein KF824_05325 [Fimbriimonadaceae bacterium]|nr:MAG: hypothetical protein KF824_05325 [Fimbriimonadaceae bacterium]